MVASAAPAQEAEEQPSFKEQFAEQLDAWMPGIGAQKIPDRQGPQQELQAICFSLGTPGREADRAEACKIIAEKLPQGNGPARIWMLKQLEFIGHGECVDSVAKLLDDPDAHVRDAARRCLQNNPDPAANAELLAHLAGAAGAWRVGLIDALGARGDKASIGALAGLLQDPDSAAAAAAAGALAKIAGSEAARALKTALAGAPETLKVRFADAYLRCADTMLEEGKVSEAAAIYDELRADESPRVIRLAALKGKLNAAGGKAGDMILDLLESDDPDAQAIAAGHVENVIGSGAMRSTPKGFTRLPASGQMLLISALAATGDRTALPLAVEAAGSGDQNVRLAALRAMATLGDASVVGLLLETLSAGGDAAGAARESLERMVADRVDEEIISAMQKTDDASRRCRLIEILDRRRATAAVPVLLQDARAHDDLGVRNWAMRSLGNLAEPQHAPDMVRLLPGTPKGREREDAEKAILSVCSRIDDEQNRADPVLSVLGGAGDEDKAAILPLVGRIGGKKALEAIQDAMNSGNAEVRDAAVRALSNWPDAGVADQLLQIARNSDNRSHRTWALRAYVRVVTLPSDRPDRQTLEMLQSALDLAARADEKRLVLTRAASLRSIETLRWVAPYLDDASLADAACQTVVELAHHRGLREPNKREFDPALKKVIEICRNQRLVERAKRYLDGS
jgi:HEAT repeat protein